jgi:hypothetical protein
MLNPDAIKDRSILPNKLANAVVYKTPSGPISGIGEMDSYYSGFDELGYLTLADESICDLNFSQTAVEDIIFPDTCSKIVRCCCENNDTLGTLFFGKHTNEIETLAFSECPNLHTVYCKSINPPNAEDDAFEACMCKTLYVPVQSVELYKRANQ